MKMIPERSIYTMRILQTLFSPTFEKNTLKILAELWALCWILFSTVGCPIFHCGLAYFPEERDALFCGLKLR